MFTSLSYSQFEYLYIYPLSHADACFIYFLIKKFGLIIKVDIKNLTLASDIQFDRGQLGSNMASDSSDRSKDKNDQKVVKMKLILCI